MTKAARAADKAGKLINTHPAAVFAIAAFLIIVLRTACGIVPALIAAAVYSAAALFLCRCGSIRRIVAAVMIFAVILGLFCSSYAAVKNAGIVHELNYKTVRAFGTVCTVPTESTVGKRFYFDAKRIYYDGGEFKNVKLYITCGEKTEVSLGDELQMNVKLFEPDFGDFDMTQTINAKGAALMGGSVEIVSKEKAGFSGIIYSVRNYLLFVADKFFKGDRRALFRALTAGDKSLFSDDLTENLRRAGISHIVSISGLHVSTLGFAIYEMLRRMNKKAALAASVLGVFFFALVAGSSPSAMRAAIMFALYMAANALTREGDSFTALAIAALILAMANPYVIFDMGFILSFLSVLSILMFSSKIRGAAAFLPKIARDAAVTTVSAQILTIPVLIFAFGEVSVYSLPANIVIGLIFPFALTMCFVMCAAAFIPFVSAVVAGVCAFCADVIIAVAGMFASLPLSGAELKGFGMAALLCYGAIVTAIFFVRKLRVVQVGGVMCFCAVVLLIGAVV